MEETCSIPGCDRVSKARGWCNTHYQRWRVHGTVDDPVVVERLCSVSGCDRKHERLGYCQMHARRLDATGDPLNDRKGGKPYMGRTAEQARAVLLSRRHITETGCWEYARGRTADGGYGAFRWRDVNLAHRCSWALFVGPIPDGMWVLHKCDNPPCFNPEHLFLGDVVDNNRDMGAKGRGGGFRFVNGHKMTTGVPGERNGGGGKLTEAQAVAIYHRGGKQADIAGEYGVSKATVCAIKAGRLWRHATGHAVGAASS